MDAAVSQAMESLTRDDMEETLIQGLGQQAGLSETDIQEYIEAMSDEDITQLYTEMAQEQYKAQYAAGVQAQMEGMAPSQLAAALDGAMETYTPEQFSQYYEEILVFSESTYEENLRTLGYVELEEPSSINIYASSFENKEQIEEMIADYNETVDELEQIHYDRCDHPDLCTGTYKGNRYPACHRRFQAECFVHV